MGKAFVDAKAIITGDSNHPDVAPLCSTPNALTNAYDQDVYRSFASIPVAPLQPGDAAPYGVLVGTSDRVGRFDKENTRILVQLAETIASLIVLANIDIDALLAAESAIIGRGSGEE